MGDGRIPALSSVPHCAGVSHSQELLFHTVQHRFSSPAEAPFFVKSNPYGFFLPVDKHLGTQGNLLFYFSALIQMRPVFPKILNLCAYHNLYSNILDKSFPIHCQPFSTSSTLKLCKAMATQNLSLTIFMSIGRALLGVLESSSPLCL